MTESPVFQLVICQASYVYDGLQRSSELALVVEGETPPEEHWLGDQRSQFESQVGQDEKIRKLAVASLVYPLPTLASCRFVSVGPWRLHVNFAPLSLPTSLTEDSQIPCRSVWEPPAWGQLYLINRDDCGRPHYYLLKTAISGLFLKVLYDGGRAMLMSASLTEIMFWLRSIDT